MAKTILQRFTEKYRVDPSRCWLWLAYKNNSGYGRIRVDGRLQSAHRVSYELHVGPIPDGLCVLHTCDVCHCVNFDHLWVGTNADNSADKIAKGRGVWAKGEQHGMAKLTEKQVLEIRATTGLYREIASQYGIDPSLVGHIKNRKSWAHL